ncbi:hypothetical protein HDIA_2614 [Hartmannibacter diazotrophicus]|uniref:DUF883 domain-containing protein n=1 Tax=Hartmannibacter diazotrophicus TaxID=1482074 RepID=A0A2C9D9A5_9HYPH|nr:DUF883 family protein [Hartmannibacter diazotrophicus]SON56155.1 hypothetical protein HDIA_2614 [Hartmannibacter diazotrophicus]
MATTTQQTGKNGTAAASAEDIEAQITQLREDIAALTRSVGNFGAAKADGYKAKVNSAASDAMAASQTAVNALRAELEGAEKTVIDQVRAKPLQAIGIAAAAGFLLAVLSRR